MSLLIGALPFGNPEGGKIMWMIYAGLFIFTGLDLYAVAKGRKKLEYLSKPLLMPLVLAAYLMKIREIQFYLVMGLFFGWLGDLFLMMDKEICFLAGLLSFLIGHLNYSYTFIEKIQVERERIFAYLLSFLCYLLYLVFVCGKLFPVMEKKKKPPVFIYMIVISMMSYLSLLRFISVGRTGFMTFAGSVLFVISDTMIAFLAFRNLKRKKVTSVMIMTTYVSAQYLIMLGTG